MNHSAKDVMRAYVTAFGLFRPTRYVWRPFGEVLEVDRCVVDGGIVTNSQSSLSRHHGHRMNQPVILSLWEVFCVWVRIIR